MKKNLFSKLFLVFMFSVSLVLWSCDDTSSSHTSNDAGDLDVPDSDIDDIDDIDDTTDASDTEDSTDVEETPPVAVIEVTNLDLWARPLSYDATYSMVCGDSDVLPESGHVSYVGHEIEFPFVSFKITDSATCVYTVSANDYRTLTFSFEVTPDGTVSLDRAGIDGQGLSVAHTTKNVDDHIIPVHSFYTGLRHKWFSAEARSPKKGNSINLYMDGESSWENIYNDLINANDRVLWSSWWWQSDFELLRDYDTYIGLSEEERRQNTALDILASLPVVKRVLVGEFWGDHSIVDFMTRDAELQSYAETPDDNFEFMGQGNPTSDQFYFSIPPFSFKDRLIEKYPELSGTVFDPEPEIESEVPGKNVDFSDWPGGIAFQIASWHQKFLVMDDNIAWVGGMNVKDVNWDTSEHKVFEFRRMDFKSSERDRLDVLNKESEPDYPPRKDYFLRIEGPATQDVAEVFKTRWDYLLSEGAEYSENNSAFEINRNIPFNIGGKEVQITTTMPEPFWEHGILESWYNAVMQAENYIFIEDQYWRIPVLTDLILERMRLNPNLKLIVFTMPINEWTDGGCYWTYKTNQDLMLEFPDRYYVFQLRSFDTNVTWGIDETNAHFSDIYIHSKLMIVDDKFMSIGSCNKNNRGVIYEGEMSAAVLAPAWVKQQRRRILANMLKTDIDSVSDNSEDWISQLEVQAAWNDYVYNNWDDEGWDINCGDGSDPIPSEYIPNGFVYSLEFNDPSECLIENVGPDLF